MIGGRARFGSGTGPPQETYQPKVVCPDRRRERQKEVYYKAIQSLVRQLKELLVTANEPGEAEVWRQQLARLGL